MITIAAAMPITAAVSPRKAEISSAGSMNAASTVSTFPMMLKIIR